MSADEQQAFRKLQPPAQAAGRIFSIDVFRGLAILWVIVLHLWADITVNLGGVRPLYQRLGDRIAEGHPVAALTAFGELVFGSGYQGVAMFMMLSGLSLTLNAHRRGEPGLLQGYRSRLRKLLVPYWGGVGILVGAVALVALLMVIFDGGSFREQWWNVRIGALLPVNFRLDDVLYALSVFGWLFREKISTAPVGSLWFVSLLIQYYLLFPFALWVLRRAGPWWFAAGGLALTLAMRALLVGPAVAWLDVRYVPRTIESFAPFRGSEFFLGMSLGYLLVHNRAAVGEWVRGPFEIGSLLVLAFLLQMAGGMLAPVSDGYLVVADPLVQVALALYMLPLLFRGAEWLQGNVLARALTFLGVVSFPALILNDAMRYMASFLRMEDIPGAAWWFFLVVIYVPVGTLLAYPLARLFGVLPRSRSYQRPAPAPAHAEVEMQPAGGG